MREIRKAYAQVPTLSIIAEYVIESVTKAEPIGTPQLIATPDLISVCWSECD
jgi:hypothetical protein